MLNFKQILHMHCREASRLASDALDRPLNLSERIGMWAHMAICVSCRRMQRQIRLVQQWAEELSTPETMLEKRPTAELSESRREQIKHTLRQSDS